MTNTNETLGKRIRSVRRALGLTQKQLANKLNRNQTDISNWEMERYNVHRKYFNDLSRCLSIPINEIWALASNEDSTNESNPAPRKETTPDDPQNIFSIINATCEALKSAPDPILTLDDVFFLLDLQKKLPTPMSPELIAELLKNRKRE